VKNAGHFKPDVVTISGFYLSSGIIGRSFKEMAKDRSIHPEEWLVAETEAGSYTIGP
jgi:hypothetical protein